MNFRVGGIAELLRNPGIRQLGRKLLGAADGSLHSLGRRGQDQLRPEESEQCAALQAHALRHGQDQFVSLGRRSEGECNASIAAGRLDDRGVGRETSIFLRSSDHGGADAVFDAPERIVEFPLDRDRGGQALRYTIQFDEGRPADRSNHIFKVSHTRLFKSLIHPTSTGFRKKTVFKPPGSRERRGRVPRRDGGNRQKWRRSSCDR